MLARQLEIALRTWGGRRRGAGRKPAGAKPAAPHQRRAELARYQPVHVTIRMARHVWNLRSERSFAIVDAALRGVRRRADFRVVHFSVQGNHLHLLAEADGTRSLANGMRALSIRLARGLNRMMGRKGPVLEDRYHAHVLRTPTEVRNALQYVLGNYAGHAAAWGERPDGSWVDPFSSASGKIGRNAQQALFVAPATTHARTWSLRNQDVTPGVRARPEEMASRP